MSDSLLLHARRHQGAPPRTPSATRALPTLVDEKTGTTTSVTNAASATTITLAVDDQLVLKRIRDNGSDVGTWSAPSSTGGASAGQLTWTIRATINVSSKCQVDIYTSSRLTAAAAVTVSSGAMSTGNSKSMVVEAWRGAATFDGTQAILQLSGPGTTGLPDQHLLTSKLDQSVCTWASGDWSAAAPGTPNYGAATAQLTHDLSAGADYVAYFGRQAAPLAGPQRTGVRTPASQNWTMAGLEVQGLASGGATDQALTGTVAATSATTGAVTARVALAGTVAAVTALSGAIGISQGLSGSVAATSSAAGSIGVAQGLAGSVAATSSTSGAITANHPLSGSVAATTSTAGAPVADHPLGGTVAATTTTSGTPGTQQAIAGTVAATTATTGALTLRGALSGTSAATTTTAGAPTSRQGIAGTVNAVSSTAGTFFEAGAQVYPIVGNVTATTTTAGAITAQHPLAGTVAAVSTAAGAIARASALAGSVAGTSLTVGNMTVRVVLSGSSAASSAILGSPSAGYALSGQVQAVSGTAGSFVQPATNFQGRILSVALSIPAATGSIAAMSASGDLESHAVSGRLSILHAKGVLT